MPPEPSATNVDAAPTTAEFRQLLDMENGGFDDILVLTLTEQEIRLFADLYNEVEGESRRAEQAANKDKFQLKRKRMLGTQDQRPSRS